MLYTALATAYWPACETERPANSISWSIEKAPVLINSLSKAAAFLAESVWILSRTIRYSSHSTRTFVSILIIRMFGETYATHWSSSSIEKRIYCHVRTPDVTMDMAWTPIQLVSAGSGAGSWTGGGYHLQNLWSLTDLCQLAARREYSSTAQQSQWWLEYGWQGSGSAKLHSSILWWLKPSMLYSMFDFKELYGWPRKGRQETVNQSRF